MDKGDCLLALILFLLVGLIIGLGYLINEADYQHKKRIMRDAIIEARER